MTEAKNLGSSNSEPSAKRGSRNAFYIAIAVVLVIVGVLAAFVFLRGVMQPTSKAEPIVTDTTVGFDNYGRTYRLFVTVHNNGANGQVKVFAEVKAVQNGNVGFAQTQDKSAYIDNGGSTTITFEFNSDWLALSDIQLSRNVWAIAP